MLTLCVGDGDGSLSAHAHQLGSSAQLLVKSNFKQFLDQKYNLWYTSLADLEDLELFEQAIVTAETIYYFPPDQWSHASIQPITEHLLFKYAHHKNIKNFNVQSSDPLNIFAAVSNRNGVENQLWAVGCGCTSGEGLSSRLWAVGDSFTSGVGVEQDQRWGVLLAQQLEMSVSFLAHPGGSIDWQARQILSADLVAGDIVCWLMPSINRYEFTNNFVVDPNHFEFFNLGAYEEKTNWVPTFLLDRSLIKKVFPVLHDVADYKENLHWFVRHQFPYQIIVEHLHWIKQAQHRCTEIGAKLYVLTQKVMGDDCQEGIFDFYLRQLIPNYLGKFDYGYSDFPDLGDDQVHPGPYTHQLYATKFCQVIK
jgi:hypothetical protein